MVKSYQIYPGYYYFLKIVTLEWFWSVKYAVSSFWEQTFPKTWCPIQTIACHCLNVCTIFSNDSTLGWHTFPQWIKMLNDVIQFLNPFIHLSHCVIPPMGSIQHAYVGIAVFKCCLKHPNHELGTQLWPKQCGQRMLFSWEFIYIAVLNINVCSSCCLFH